MNTDVIPMIVALAVTVALVAPVVVLFIKHPPKPVNPCKVIDAFGDAVEAGRKRRQLSDEDVPEDLGDLYKAYQVEHSAVA